MNIHFFNANPVVNANFLDDIRVRKMITENFQMLASALIRHNCPKEFLPLAKNGNAYRVSHAKHPSTLWVGDSRANLFWLCDYTEALYNRYKRSGGKAFDLVLPNLENVRKGAYYLPDIGLTPFVNCARAQKLGIDFTDVSDIHEAYFSYINARWDIDTIELTWTGVDK